MHAFQRAPRLVLVCIVMALATVGVSVSAQSSGFVPVTDAILQNPDPGDWLMWRRTLNGWGFSPLDEINSDNVGRLQMVWSRGLGPGLQQGTPLVHDGVMYMPNPRECFHNSRFSWIYGRLGSKPGLSQCTKLYCT